MSEKPVDINKLSYEEVKDLLNGLDGAKNQNLEKIKSVAKEESVFYNPSNYGSYKKALETNLEKCVAFYEKVRKLLNEAIEKLYRKDENGFPVDKNFLSMLNVINANPGGSTGAKIVQAPDGTKFVMKRASKEDDVEYLNSKYATNQFYRDMGVYVPDSELYEIKKNKEYALLSKVLDGGKSLDKWLEENKDKPEKIRSMQKKLRKDFAVDVLLGNWDVVRKNTNNILVDSNDEPCRINVGCSLGFNSKGERKDENSWNRTVGWNKNEEWKKSAYFDDIWIMTGNGERIGLSVDSDIPEYFGSYDVLEIADEIIKRNWNNAIKNLSKDDGAAVELRLQEAKELAKRGNRYIQIEDMNTFPRETALKVLDYSYQLNKMGFRYVVATCKDNFPTTNSFDKTRAGLLHSEGGKSITLWADTDHKKTYHSIGEILSDFIGAEDYDYIQYTNEMQSKNSFNKYSCEKKAYILKNWGFDVNELGDDIPSFLSNLEEKGYFTGVNDGTNNQKSSFMKAIKNLKKIPSENFDKRANSFLKYDSAIQIILENAPIIGANHRTGMFTLIRTENKSYFQDIDGNIGNVKPGEQTYHKTGVCESHSHIKTVAVKGHDVVAIRVPFSRIHGLWFTERKYSGEHINGDNNEIMFYDSKQNEILADTHGLTKFYLGSDLKFSDYFAVDRWFKNHDNNKLS